MYNVQGTQQKENGFDIASRSALLLKVLQRKELVQRIAPEILGKVIGAATTDCHLTLGFEVILLLQSRRQPPASAAMLGVTPVPLQTGTRQWTPESLCGSQLCDTRLAPCSQRNPLPSKCHINGFC